MRLDKYLVHVGFGSRSEAQKMIKGKKVKVDGVVINKPEFNLLPSEAVVEVKGEKMVYQPFYHFLLNKPAGYITATEDARDETVLDLLRPEDQNKGVAPAGRLDKDTEGLLVLTSDGKLIHELLAPKKHVDKVYYAKVAGQMVPEDIEAFAAGIEMRDGTKYAPGRLEILKSGETSEILVTIHEGKFHQVKRMVQAVGKEVVYLKRIKMGGLSLPEDLPLGEYRLLTPEELELLKENE